jgi:reverse gyrase
LEICIIINNLKFIFGITNNDKVIVAPYCGTYTLAVNCSLMLKLILLLAGLNAVAASDRISLTTHQRLVDNVVERISSSTNQTITLRRSTSESHCPRPQAYKKNSLTVDMTPFQNLISVDTCTKDQLPESLKGYSDELVAIADVQALISMEKLVDCLLPLGLIPAGTL